MLSHNTLIPRDSSANLAPGAIAGIACGAGVLFLGAAALFILYWRRQRQFDREDNLYRSSTEENFHAGAMAPTVSYTMDYKMSPRHQEYAGSSYTYSPEKPTYDFSPLSINETTASAMPTHPAYIPRAMVRGNPTPSTYTRSASSASASTSLQFSHQRPSPPLHNPTPEHFTMHSSPSLHQEPYPSSDSSLGGLPLTKPRQLPPSVPALVIPSSAGSGYTSSSSNNQAPAPRPGGNKPRQYLPPRLNLSGTGSKPLHGKENTTISGPLAFPEHYQPPPQSLSERRRQARQMYDNNDEDDFSQPQTSGDKRTFRERSTSGSGGHGYGQRDRDDNRGKKGRNRSNSGTPQQQQTGFAANRHYAEIEVGRDSDIW